MKWCIDAYWRIGLRKKNNYIAWKWPCSLQRLLLTRLFLLPYRVGFRNCLGRASHLSMSRLTRRASLHGRWPCTLYRDRFHVLPFWGHGAGTCQWWLIAFCSCNNIGSLLLYWTCWRCWLIVYVKAHRPPVTIVFSDNRCHYRKGRLNRPE